MTSRSSFAIALASALALAVAGVAAAPARAAPSRRLTLRAGRDLRHPIGRAGLGGFTADPARDAAGSLARGPGTRDVLPGDRTGYFRLRLETDGKPFQRIARIDAFDVETGAVLARRVLRRRHFGVYRAYQDFALEFTAPRPAPGAPIHRVELRTHWFGTAPLAIDRVVVIPRGARPPSPPAPRPRRFDLVRVFTGPADAYKVVGLLGTRHGLFVTTSNVYRSPHRSRVYLDGRLVYEGGQETIGQPFAWRDLVFFPVEHGSHVLVWRRGRMETAAASVGRWSVAGGVRSGRPVVASNDDYHGRFFSDRPKLVDALSGAVVGQLDVLSMPRVLIRHDGELWASTNFGEEMLVSERGRRIPSPALHVASFAGKIRGGGGMAWGPGGPADGRIFELRGNRWRRVLDTGCASIQHLAVLDGRLWFAGIDPDKLFVMDADGVPHEVASIPGETAADGARDFAGSVALHRGAVYWARSDRSQPHVYRLDPR